MFDADDRYKQTLNQITTEKSKRITLRMSPKTQRQIENFRVKHDLIGNDQYVIKWIIEFVSLMEEYIDRGKKDPNFIAGLKNETNLQKHIDFIYDNCDRNESEVIRDAAQANIDRWDDYELRRKNQQLRRSK